MSIQRQFCAEAFRSLLVVSVLFVSLLVAASPAVAGQSGEPDCSAVGVATLDGSLRSFAGEAKAGTVYALTVPSAGILSVEVTVPGGPVAEPRLGFAGRGCGSRREAPEPVILDRTATHMVLLVGDPGVYSFRVAPQDPARPLGDFKLATRFAPRARSAPFLSKEGEDEEEIEIDANRAAGGEAEGRSLHAELAELCRRGDVDDHGDSLTCATFLAPGRQAAGEIANGWGDDQDVFTFVVGGPGGADLWTVEIETAGAADTFGGLYDRSGQRLEQAAAGGDGGGFRIVRTLRPGVYFVRVAGEDGGEGLYTLRVETSPG